jgi:hypothetical protein
VSKSASLQALTQLHDINIKTSIQGEEGSYSVLQHSLCYNLLAILGLMCSLKYTMPRTISFDWFSLQGLKPKALCIPHTQIDSKVNINTQK